MSNPNSINYNLSKENDKYYFRICPHCNQIQKSIFWCIVCSYDFKKGTFDEKFDKQLIGNQKIGSNLYGSKNWVTYTQFVEDDFSDDGSEDDYQEDERELDYDFDNDVKTILSLREKATHFGYCKVCTRPNLSYDWCNSCNRKILETNFRLWNSGDDNVNEFIRETQRKANKHLNYIEWVEFDSITNMKYLATGGFGIVYTGRITNEERKKSIKSWRFHAGDKIVLKALKNSQFMSKEFLNELQNYHQCFGNDMNAHLHIFGITYDPNQIEYMMVLKFAKGGDLRSILRQNYRKISWRDRIELLYGISQQLLTIHNKEIIHRDLHAGNILFDNEFYERDFFRRIYIADLGLARPCDRRHKTERGTYGVLQYTAPEIFRGQPHSKASDIYSIGILMWELSAPGQVPFEIKLYDRDALLQCAIWDGERPKVYDDTPEPWVELMMKCWQLNAEDRPTTKELFETTESWYFFKEDYKEFKVADEKQSELYAASLAAHNPNPLAGFNKTCSKYFRYIMPEQIQTYRKSRSKQSGSQYLPSHGYSDPFSSELV
ncbi:6805_t:CDS:2 [Ambispora gerdemannii]|uniref:6805_t:CDS:1 n=1 Tax=Ambispora gerdemannii TaxID=144530 RepID=A0A9N8Z9G2_9GLOM|nr:6805_t:CDS:2 [Ambispora gerdemannii]